MNRAKGIFIKSIGLALCVVFIFSCHSNNVVSSYGKRKYTKGWFWFKRKSADTKAEKGKDSSLTHKYPKLTRMEEKNSVSTVAPGKEKEEQEHKKLSRRAKRDSVKLAAKTRAPENKTDKNKTKPPPEPPDPVMLRLLILVLVLTGLSVFTTGLITPIIIWGITQNFLIGTGLIFTLFAFLFSINGTLEIRSANKRVDKPYNLGKPAWILSLWAVIPLAFLYVTIKTSLLANLLLVQIATIGLFAAGACILLSVLLAIKALFVNDRHKGKAVFALIIDAALITAGILFL